MTPEIQQTFVISLLVLQGALQQYVDNLFEMIFSTMNRRSVLPAAIKYMFDFLDDLALQNGIVDPQVVHTWKSNRCAFCPSFSFSPALTVTYTRNSQRGQAPFVACQYLLLSSTQLC